MAKGELNSLQYSLCETARLSQHDVAIVIVEEPRLYKSSNRGLRRSILKTLSLSLKHIKVGLQIATEKQRDAVIVPDFSTEFLWLAYVFSGFRTQNVYTLVHHNAQQALHNAWMRRLLKFYNFLGYKFILNETLSALNDLGYQSPERWGNAVLLHPVKSEEITAESPTRSICRQVGIVGSVRKGKRFEETLERMLKLQQQLDFTLVVGVDQPDKLSHLQADDRVILRNTSAHADYLSVIESCDVIVLNYDESQYRYRCSGVAADAIGTKTYVVAPDYPMIRHQLLHPAPVGVLYQAESDLEMALQNALNLPSPQTNPAFEQHYTQRSVQGLAVALDRILTEKASRRRPAAYPKAL